MGLKKSKNIIILGGAGFIGYHTAKRFISVGHTVTIFDSLNEKSHSAGRWPNHIRNLSCSLINGNINSRSDLENALIEQDIIIMLAAEMDMNPEYYNFYSTNVSGVSLLFEVIRKKKFQISLFFYASTQFVYSAKGKRINLRVERNPNLGIWDDVDETGKIVIPFYSETDNPAPPNHYAQSKYFGEQLSLLLGKLNNIPVRVGRFSIIHGEYQSLKNTYSGALRTFAFYAYLNQDLPTFEDNQSLRDFTSVEDAVKGIELIIDLGRDFEIYNISSSTPISILNLGQLVINVSQKKVGFSKKIEFRTNDVRHAISCNDKLKGLGFLPSENYENVIHRYWQWFNRNVDDYSIRSFIETQRKIRENGQIVCFKN